MSENFEKLEGVPNKDGSLDGTAGQSPKNVKTAVVKNAADTKKTQPKGK